MITVYKHTNRLNGRSYIGITHKTVDQRFKQHMQWAARGSRFAFHCALRKYGADAFDSSVLATTTSRAEALTLERGFIAQFNTIANGYNMTEGGDGFAGLIRTKEHARAISSALKGHSVSAETRQKLSRYRGSSASFYGKKQSAEWHAMMKDIRRRTFRPKGSAHVQAKRYIVVHPDGREEQIHGLSAFCREHGLDHSGMSMVAAGKRAHHKNFKCRVA